MEQAENAVSLFQGLIGLGGLVAIVWSAGFVVFGLRQLKNDFKEHEAHCDLHAKDREDIKLKQVNVMTRLKKAESEIESLWDKKVSKS